MTNWSDPFPFLPVLPVRSVWPRAMWIWRVEPDPRFLPLVLIGLQGWRNDGIEKMSKIRRKLFFFVVGGQNIHTLFFVWTEIVLNEWKTGKQWFFRSPKIWSFDQQKASWHDMAKLLQTASRLGLISPGSDIDVLCVACLGPSQFERTGGSRWAATSYGCPFIRIKTPLTTGRGSPCLAVRKLMSFYGGDSYRKSGQAAKSELCCHEAFLWWIILPNHVAYHK